MKHNFLSFFTNIFKPLQQVFSSESEDLPAKGGEKEPVFPEEEKLYGEYKTSSLLQKKTKPVIVVDRKVREKYRSGWENKIRKKSPEEIVIHGTAGGRSVAGLLHWMYNWGRSGYRNGVSLFHYAIGRGDKDEKDGLIVEIIDPEFWVYHSTSGKHAKVEIGIELLNPSKSNRDPYTDAQYNSLFNLIFDHLLIIYPTITRITSHRGNIWRYNSDTVAEQKDKNCPGNFDWSRLEIELNERNYAYQMQGDQLYYNIFREQDIGRV